jgi:hypothetical protein
MVFIANQIFGCLVFNVGYYGIVGKIINFVDGRNRAGM